MAIYHSKLLAYQRVTIEISAAKMRFEARPVRLLLGSQAGMVLYCVKISGWWCNNHGFYSD